MKEDEGMKDGYGDGDGDVVRMKGDGDVGM